MYITTGSIDDVVELLGEYYTGFSYGKVSHDGNIWYNYIDVGGAKFIGDPDDEISIGMIIGGYNFTWTNSYFSHQATDGWG